VKNLEFRAPGRGASVAELLDRAWPRSDRSQRKRLLAAGELRVAGEIVRDPSFRVAAGALVRMVAREGQHPPSAAPIEILLQGDDYCVVDKPAGWPSHAATPGGPDARSLVAAALNTKIELVWPVHRLDADVSGAWLIALSKAAAARLYESFAASEVEKEYRAIVPALPWPEGIFRGGVDGKPAQTGFRVVKQVAEKVGRKVETRVCEVSLSPVTGRTHQLRRHLEGARCPILGDPLFGGIMIAGGLRLYSRRIAIPKEGIDATCPEPRGFVPTERVLPQPEAPVPITVSNATAVALERGHPWILTDSETSDVGGYAPGTLARARTARGRDVGVCRIQGSGRIAARVWGGDSADVGARIRTALRRRSRLLGAMDGENATTAFRLVHGEADALPGLLIDLLGDELRMIRLWHGCDSFASEAIDAVIEQLEAEWIEHSHRKAASRKLRGVVGVRHFVDRPKGEFVCVEPLRGRPREEPFSVRERGMSFEIDSGLSEPRRSRPGIGLFMDQRSNRERIAKRIRAARGGRWLNLFCHTGAFSAAALAAGADEVISVDLSRPYLDVLQRNLECNDLDASKHQSVKYDAQRYIEKLANRERFDGIILDPPTAAAVGKRFWTVRKRQAELIALCLQRLRPGGHLLACRNDHSAKDSLRDRVFSAAKAAGVGLASVEAAPPGRDFPRLDGFREGDSFEGVLATRS
jgi:23S rRNA (cytosine1962-C5)-methyltransferase